MKYENNVYILRITFHDDFNLCLTYIIETNGTNYTLHRVDSLTGTILTPISTSIQSL